MIGLRWRLFGPLLVAATRCTWAAVLACALYMLGPDLVAQEASPAAGADPFIVAIETMKRSVLSADCLQVNGKQPKLLKRLASAFLISDSGDFLTAAHVLTAMQKDDYPCPIPAVTMAVGEWRPELPREDMLWFPFNIEECRIDGAADVAECRPSGDLPARLRKSHRATPIQFEWNPQPDGTHLAFTGFPLEARDPMTFRAHVAAYQTPWPDQSLPELILDHASLPGFSGSPVFLPNGKVVAIVIRDGKPDAPGISIARPVWVFRKMIEETGSGSSPAAGVRDKAGRKNRSR